MKFSKLIILMFFLFALPSIAVAEFCLFPNPQNELTRIENCLSESEKINPAALKKIQFNENGLASGSIGKRGCFWLKRNGEFRKTHCFDNGADYFSEGLARAVDEKGKFGYMNQSLRTVITPSYTFGFPFEKGEAWVCLECKEFRKKESEYTSIQSDQWIIINKNGKILRKCTKLYDNKSCIKGSSF